MAAKIDRVDQVYWDEVIKPLVDSHPNVEFIGEINEKQKAKFLGEASALIFPIDWPEPFGLVMIEAMVCGTPVIAFRSGSTPEVVDDGVTGFLVDDVDEAVAAVARVTKLNRDKVRARFDERFAIERVAEDYLNIYRALPGVRRVARRIPGPHQAQLAGFGAPIFLKPCSLPGLQPLGAAQAEPTE
jgi:glycosyltransferase involved in cell wall biosynthesis